MSDRQGLEPQDLDRRLRAGLAVNFPAASLQALDRFLAAPDSLDAWRAAFDAFDVAPNQLADLVLARATLVDGTENDVERVRQSVANLLHSLRPLNPAARFRPATEVGEPLPRPLLRATGMGGAVLSEGAVCLLSGSGGAAKSTLAATVALDVANGGELADPGDLAGLRVGLSNLFDVHPGPVMFGSYEDPPAVLSARLRDMAEAINVVPAALKRIHLADLSGLPLYGPPPDNGMYNARPEPLRGWSHLWVTADRVKPALVVIDPALDAFTGEGINIAAVREFVGALTNEARARSCGVLLVAHSNKSARPGKANERENPFDAGQVGGTAAWTDRARGVLTLTGRGDDRTLAIPKANWGPRYVLVKLTRVDNKRGALVGFRASDDGWQSRTPAMKTGREAGYDAGR